MPVDRPSGRWPSRTALSPEHGIEAARLYNTRDIDGAIRGIARVGETSRMDVRYLEELPGEDAAGANGTCCRAA